MRRLIKLAQQLVDLGAAHRVDLLAAACVADQWLLNVATVPYTQATYQVLSG
jgi:hypothetical protein